MKKLATWLLAAAFTTAALPAFAVEPSVQVGYSPEGSARVLVLSAIDSAKTSIRMMAYSFTAPDIMKALVAAKKRGVDVKIVIDERGNTGRASIAAMNYIANSGIPLRTDSNFPIQHDKVIIVDNVTVERGLTLSGTKTHVKQRFLPLTPLLMVSDVLWSPVLPA